MEMFFLHFLNTGNSWFNMKTNAAKLCCQQCLSLSIIPEGKKTQMTEKAPAQISTMCKQQPTLTSHYDTVVNNILEIQA